MMLEVSSYIRICKISDSNQGERSNNIDIVNRAIPYENYLLVLIICSHKSGSVNWGQLPPLMFRLYLLSICYFNDCPLLN